MKMIDDLQECVVLLSALRLDLKNPKHAPLSDVELVLATFIRRHHEEITKLTLASRRG